MQAWGLRVGLWAAMFVAAAGPAGASAAIAQTAARVTTPPELRVDINHAGVDELLKVPGLSRVWAARIVRFRPYRTKEDLTDKGVLPGAVYDRIKDFIIAHHDKPVAAALPH
jgi:DNA uptake protein ComE-like DNA-binding protein